MAFLPSHPHESACISVRIEYLHGVLPVHSLLSGRVPKRCLSCVAQTDFNVLHAIQCCVWFSLRIARCLLACSDICVSPVVGCAIISDVQIRRFERNLGAGRKALLLHVMPSLYRALGFSLISHLQKTLNLFLPDQSSAKP